MSELFAPSSVPRSAVHARRFGRDHVHVAALLLATALLYLWRLSASGYANSFYAAAVQAGTESWKAFFFGSLDRSNFITVDKPPASLWVMELSGRLFGFSSWSMLAPQAFEGVAAVGLLYATVRRWYGRTAGLFAGAALAVTPVAVAMFRFNNPDASMVLLLVAAAYCMVRAIKIASTRWLLIGGVALGFAFLAKGLQPMTVVPGFALAYLVTAPATRSRRVWQLAGAGIALLISAGWWVLAVSLWPKAQRPYIGGSKDNTPLGLALGSNGLGRLDGSSAVGERFSGTPGPWRLFSPQLGAQIAWLLPVAVLAGVVLAGRWIETAHTGANAAPRPNRAAASLLLWGGWLLVTGAVLSFMDGASHSYYTVQLAPPIAALVAGGGAELWRSHASIVPRLALAGGVLISAWTAWELLGRLSDWQPELRYLVAGIALVGAAASTSALWLTTRNDKFIRNVSGRGLAGIIATAILVAPLALSVQTASLAQGGASPAAGIRAVSSPPAPPGRSVLRLIALLRRSPDRWVLAAVTAQKAAVLELDSGGLPVMALGGYGDVDETPNLQQFVADVQRHEIGYYAPGGAEATLNVTSSAIRRWVHKHYRPITIGAATLYDLSAPIG